MAARAVQRLVGNPAPKALGAAPAPEDGIGAEQQNRQRGGLEAARRGARRAAGEHQKDHEKLAWLAQPPRSTVLNPAVRGVMAWKREAAARWPKERPCH